MADPPRQPNAWTTLTDIVAWSDEAIGTLPTTPGVYAFENADGHTLRLTTTSNLRRAVRDRRVTHVENQSSDPSAIDPVWQVNHVAYAAAGSRLESDLIYLETARDRLPHTYARLFDRLACWFVTCDVNAAFPRWTKQKWPGATVDDPSAWIGPFLDKHVAQRYIEMLENAFDLCRYHHILTQSPRGVACAYKEMGRCAAPCDGTVTMDDYRASIRAAIAFARTPYEDALADLEQRMTEASAALEFEIASALHRHHGAISYAGHAKAQLARGADALRGVIMASSPTLRHVRVFSMAAGRIVLIGDADTVDSAEVMIEQGHRRAGGEPVDVTPAAQERFAVLMHGLEYARRKGDHRVLVHWNGDPPLSPRWFDRCTAASGAREDGVRVDADEGVADDSFDISEDIPESRDGPS